MTPKPIQFIEKEPKNIWNWPKRIWSGPTLQDCRDGTSNNIDQAQTDHAWPAPRDANAACIAMTDPTGPNIHQSFLSFTDGPLYKAAEIALKERDIAQDKIVELEAVLKWYARHVSECRLYGSSGDAARSSLTIDGGKRARFSLGSWYDPTQ